MTDTMALVPIDPDTARELHRAARQMDSFRARRDRLIVEAIEQQGAGIREVARLVGLTHPAVLKILRRRRGTNDDG